MNKKNITPKTDSLRESSNDPKQEKPQPPPVRDFPQNTIEKGHNPIIDKITKKDSHPFAPEKIDPSKDNQ